MDEKRFIATVQAGEAFCDLFNALIFAKEAFDDLVEATPAEHEDFQLFREIRDNFANYEDSFGDWSDDLFYPDNSIMGDCMHDYEAYTKRSLATVEYDADTLLANYISDLC